ncbi:MAG: hypothetical protein Q9174_004035 [Haloplaca sp. 1 TL-2023]
MADKYLLRVTAGPSYDPASHHVVAVNTSHPTTISSILGDTTLSVRIQNYRGLPRGSPSTSSYFSQPPHTHDQYSIGFSFVPRRNIAGNALVFGNDFDHPIRDRIPPGFNAAFRIVKWAIDPGLDGDVYADKPHLYGNALSSINVLNVGPKVRERKSDNGWTLESEYADDPIKEGGYEGGQELRENLQIPDDAAARQKWFLGGRDRLDKWQWEEGRLYKADFFNPYLDFNEFALKLPGFSLKVLGYLGGEDYLRHVKASIRKYVLKDKDTDEILFVVVFSLVPKEQIEEEEAVASHPHDAKVDGSDTKTFEPRADDLD